MPAITDTPLVLLPLLAVALDLVAGTLGALGALIDRDGARALLFVTSASRSCAAGVVYLVLLEVAAAVAR